MFLLINMYIVYYRLIYYDIKHYVQFMRNGVVNNSVCFIKHEIEKNDRPSHQKILFLYLNL